ncbi:MAG: two-component system NtrC family sensor kinase [Arenicella sp.]|jgi:two-component system NtrC family sensor kinase
MNLVGNAVDAIKDKGNVTIHTSNISDKLIISIADDGMGISEKVRSNIFNPFFTTKGVGKGTGLGLSIVHGIVEKHEGKIEVISEEGQGAEFIIELPTQVMS